MKQLVISAILFGFVACDVKIETRDGPRSDEGRTKRDMEVIYDSATRFKRDVGRFPSSGEGLLALLRDPGSAAGWSGPYLHARGKPDSLMIKDWFGTDYKFISLSHQEVEIVSAGKDRRFGTQDDIKVNSKSRP